MINTAYTARMQSTQEQRNEAKRVTARKALGNAYQLAPGYNSAMHPQHPRIPGIEAARMLVFTMRGLMQTCDSEPYRFFSLTRGGMLPYSGYSGDK